MEDPFHRNLCTCIELIPDTIFRAEDVAELTEEYGILAEALDAFTAGDDNNDTHVQHKNYYYDLNSFVVIKAASEDDSAPF